MEENKHQDCGPYGPKGTFTCGPSCDMECIEEDSNDSTMGASVEENEQFGATGQVQATQPLEGVDCDYIWTDCHGCTSTGGFCGTPSGLASGEQGGQTAKVYCGEQNCPVNAANSGDVEPAHGQGDEVPQCAQTCQGKPTTCEMAFEFMEPQGCGGSCPQAMKDHLLMDMGCSPATAATGGGDSANIDGGAKVQDGAAELLGDDNNDDEAANIDADAKVENVAADLLDELER
jgi:hypothetical protein